MPPSKSLDLTLQVWNICTSSPAQMLALKLWSWSWTFLLIVIAEGETPRCFGREITSWLSAPALRIPAIVAGNPGHPFLATAVNFALSPPPSSCDYTASVSPLKAERCLSPVLLVPLPCSKLLFQVEMGWNAFRLKEAISELPNFAILLPISIYGSKISFCFLWLY